MISFKEIVEIGGQAQLNENSFPFTQTFTYGQIQKKMGRKIKNFDILNQDKKIGSILIVEYPLFGKLTYWYAPYGPILDTASKEIISGVKDELEKCVKENNVAFVRLDFTFIEKNNSNILSEYFKQSPLCSTVGAYFQPRDEWYTNINKTSEEILNTMHSKTRYSVRLAEKKGIKTFVTNINLVEKLPVFLNLMKQTSLRNGFALHNNDYYKYYFAEAEKTKRAFLVEGIYEGEVLATHFVLIVGDVAHYIFGASSDEYKDLCAPYLVHFQSMLRAKEMGAKYYNFGAVSLGEENKKWQGLSIFKQKFGGEVIKHEPLYDLVLKPFWYYLYIARKLFKKYI